MIGKKQRVVVWPPSTDERGGCAATTIGQGWPHDHHNKPKVPHGQIGLIAWPVLVKGGHAATTTGNGRPRGHTNQISSHPDQIRLVVWPPLS
jgi:hypothetical protein